MKRNHKRRKGSPRSQYSLFDYILVIGVIALITGAVYYFAKAFYEPKDTQVVSSAKKSKEIKLKAVIIEPEEKPIAEVAAEETLITESEIKTPLNALKPKPAVEPKPKKKKQRAVKIIPRESIVAAEPEVIAENTEAEHIGSDTVHSVSQESEIAEQMEPVEPEPTNEIIHEVPVMTIEPANFIEPVITIEPVSEPIQTEIPLTETTPKENAPLLELDPEDVLPQLFETIQDDKADVLEELINLYASGDHTIDINAVSSIYEYNALHFAAMTGKLESLRMILNRKDAFNFKVDDRSKDSDTNTALLLACYNSKHFPDVAVEVVALLLDHGAEIELADLEGHSPLFSAVLAAHLGVVNLLLERNANVLARTTEHSHTVLHVSMRSCDRSILKSLIDHGADIHALNLFNRQPIHEAAFYGCVDGLRELILTRGVDKQTRTPAKADEIYSEKHHEECFGLATPLHFAAIGSELPAIEFLFLLCAEYYAKDEAGKIAANYAKTLEIDYYFEDRCTWENEQKGHFGKLQQTIGMLRRYDRTGVTPDSKRYKKFANGSLHIPRNLRNK